MTKKQLIKELQTLWSKTKNFFKRIFKRKHKVTDEELAEMIEIPIDTTYKPSVFEMLEEQHLTNDTSVTYDNNYDYEATKELPQAFQCGGVENAGKILKVDTDGYIRLSEGGGSAEVYFIELSGTSGTLTEKDKEILMSGEPTLNYINKDGMIFHCVFYGSTKAVYSIAGESKNHAIEINLNTGAWKLTTYNLQPTLTAGDNISIENNVISAKDVLTSDRIAVGEVYSLTTGMKQLMEIHLPNKLAWLVLRVDANPEYGSKPFYVGEEGFQWGQDFWKYDGGHYYQLEWDGIIWRILFSPTTNILTIRCSSADIKMFAIAI